MRNNVYSDTFWYRDMFLPVWAKYENFSNFHIQYIWKIVRGWHRINSLIWIFIRTGQEMFPKKCEISKCHIFLISHPIFIIFSLFYRKKCTLSFKIDSILEWISLCLRTHQNKIMSWQHLLSDNCAKIMTIVQCNINHFIMEWKGYFEGFDQDVFVLAYCAVTM